MEPFLVDKPPVIPPAPPPPFPERPSSRPGSGGTGRLRRFLVSLGVVGLLVLKFGAKLKFLILPVLKFFPAILKTGGTMLASVWLYAMSWGWWFALGFVLLIFVHECGHLLAAKRVGLKVGAPVFIPFMGAIIALKEAPRNAWIEAQVGIGGPLLGALGAVVSDGIYLATGNPLFRGLAYTGYLLNLFNLAPIGFLDGGRIVTALSPWLWVVGTAVIAAMMIAQPNVILLLILVLSLPRLFFLFRRKTEAERRYFEVPPLQRALMAVLYFGLATLLVAGMTATHIRPER